MSELKPCPFCGSEFTQVRYIGFSNDRAFERGYRGECCDCFAITKACTDPAEAAAAWNRRAAVELEDFFYLPKPKQQLFGITTGLSFDDLGIKVTGTIDAYAFTDAILNWQAEMLNEKIVKRICEVWNPERTCKMIPEGDGGLPRCSACGTVMDAYDCNWLADGSFEYIGNYCIECGAKVVQ